MRTTKTVGGERVDVKRGNGGLLKNEAVAELPGLTMGLRAGRQH